MLAIVLRNGSALFAGVVVGALVNMALVILGSVVIPAPEGLDATTTEGLKEGAHLLTNKHYLFPFFAHSAGTFAGASIATLIAVSHRRKLALVVGAFFLVGGIMMATMVPAPLWFLVLDLGVAYLPMAWMGGSLVSKILAAKKN